MKKLFVLLFVLTVIAGTSQALTIFEDFGHDVIADTTDGWILSQEAEIPNTNVYVGGSVVGQPGDYINSGLYRTRYAGYEGLWHSVGSLFPAGTTGGNMQECWMQWDYQCQGSSGYWTANFGLYNSNGTNANASSFQVVGVQIVGTTVAAGGPNGFSAGYVSGAPSAIERVKQHIHNVGGNTIIDTDVFVYDPVADTYTVLYSDHGFVAMTSSQSLTYTLDAFGNRNAYDYANRVRGVGFHFDNFYFSTEGECTYAPDPFVVPEPATIAILALGGFLFARRKR